MIADRGVTAYVFVMSAISCPGSPMSVLSWAVSNVRWYHAPLERWRGRLQGPCGRGGRPGKPVGPARAVTFDRYAKGARGQSVEARLMRGCG
jgi:hypothetical protein